MTPIPIEEALTLPAETYTEKSWLDWEEKNLLTAATYVCHESQISQPGSYHWQKVGKIPVIAVKNADNQIRLFYNICRHRAGSLMPSSPNGKTRFLQCGYHGWSYDLDGKLIGCPKTKGSKNFDPSQYSLFEIPFDNYQGLIFARFPITKDDQKDLWDYISKTIHPIDLRNFQFAKRVVYKIKCNWKVYLDNYLEGYHIDWLHPELKSILDMSGYQTSVFKHSVLQTGPIQGSDNPYHTDGSAYYFTLFPNLLLNIVPGRLQLNVIQPISHEETQVIFDYLYADKSASQMDQILKDDLHISDLIQQQDIEICEIVQQNLNTGIYHAGRYSPSEELGVYHFHQYLREAYGDRLPPQ